MEFGLLNLKEIIIIKYIFIEFIIDDVFLKL